MISAQARPATRKPIMKNKLPSSSDIISGSGYEVQQATANDRPNPTTVLKSGPA
jgi:hypothetical protein